jgi:hypothetical protein
MRLLRLRNALFVSTALLGACGETSSPTTASGGPGVSTGPQILLQANFSLRDPATTFAQTGRFPDTLYLPFNVSVAGTLQARVTYGSASNNVSFTIVQGTCSASNMSACGPIVGQPSGSGTPKTFSQAAFPAGPYTWLIFNLGPAAESGTYELTLSR